MTGETADSQTMLAEACGRWQSGRNGGSSLLRGAARVLTGVDHYFRADFITGYEDRARGDEQVLAEARALLEALVESERRDAEGWAECAAVPGGGFCGRGLQAKPAEDSQIEAELRAGSIKMPLWGVSLNREIAEGYGSKDGAPSRFVFHLDGAFPAVVSWRHSGIKAEEQELITGGHYQVVDVQHLGRDQDEVLLAWDRPLTIADAGR